MSAPARAGRSSIDHVHTWIWFVFLAVVLIKLPIAAFMLWFTFRSDAALEARAAAEKPDSGEDEGGSKTLPGGFRRHWRPRGPIPGRGPRRGPHGGSAPPSPARIRVTKRDATRVRARQ
jgi:hypothetical protein